MINLEKISSQFDLKDLDTEKLISLATVHQKSIVKIVLLAGTFLVGGMYFNDFHAKDQGLHMQINQMQEKLDSIKERDVALGELADFKSTVPSNLSESELITLISQYSKLYQISILSLLPGDTK